MDTNLKFIPTSEGGKKLIYKWYMFLKQRSMKNGIKWRCVDRDWSAMVITTSHAENGSSALEEIEHSHAPDWSR